MRTLLVVLALGALSGCSSCAELSVARPFPCDQSLDDATQCPAGWRCGSERRCFDASPNAGRPSPCRDSARDCADQWRCGAPDSLGVQRCQRVGEGGPYPCRDSADCEADWRCDPVAKACSDVADVLSQSRLSGLTVDTLSPRLPVGLPRFAVVGGLQSSVDRGLGAFADGRLQAWDRDGTTQLLSSGARELVTLTGGEAAGLDDKQLAVRRDDDVLVLAPRGPDLALDAGARPLAVFGTTSLVWVVTDAQARYVDLASSGGSVVALDGGAPVPRLGAASTSQVLLGTGTAPGLPDRWSFASPNTWEAVSGACEACPLGGPPTQVYLDRRGGRQLYVRCPKDPLPVARSWNVRLESQTDCSQTRYRPSDEPDEPFQTGFVPATTTLNWRAHAGTGGRAWYSEDNNVASTADGSGPLHPLVLDRTPDFVGRVTLQGQSTVAALAGSYAFTASPAGLVSEVRPNSESDFAVLGVVTGTTQLLITTQGVFDLSVTPRGQEAPQQIAQLRAGEAPLTPPTFGTLVPLSDGRRLLVIASRDMLYAAEVSAQLARDGGVASAYLPPAELSTRLVPAPGVPVRDLAVGALSSSNAGSRAQGSFYALARDTVYGIAIIDEDSWEATPIPLPADFGALRELWTEAGRGRVAYERGYISALPTAIALTEPLPEGTASDFARLCGDTLALVGSSVMRYSSDAGWLTVPGVALGDDAGARFFESVASTFIATRDGRVLELIPARDGGLPVCPPAP